MPGRSRAPAASRATKKAHELVNTGSPKQSGIPRANGFNGFLRALPGEPGFLATIASRIFPRSLISASGYRDHATSPSAKALPVLQHFASIASRSQRLVTIAKRPS
jgi:hypothetical protein